MFILYLVIVLGCDAHLRADSNLLFGQQEDSVKPQDCTWLRFKSIKRISARFNVVAKCPSRSVQYTRQVKSIWVCLHLTVSDSPWPEYRVHPQKAHNGNTRKGDRSVKHSIYVTNTLSDCSIPTDPQCGLAYRPTSSDFTESDDF